jgi:hypothetical protein
VVVELHQLFEGGIFRTVVQHDLPFDITDDMEHKIDFFFFVPDAGVNVEKGCPGSRAARVPRPGPALHTCCSSGMSMPMLLIPRKGRFKNKLL